VTVRPQKSGQAFCFSKENDKKAKEFVSRYPEGKQASAVIALFDLAQRQSGGWLPEEAIFYVAQYLDMPLIRATEVATFYTMFNLKPVGEHFVQVCTTTPCWLRGTDAILATCKKELGIGVGQTTKDRKFTIVEVECLGACVNAPIVQINDDFYEDLDAHSFGELLVALKAGKPINPGSALARQCSAPAGFSPQVDAGKTTAQKTTITQKSSSQKLADPKTPISPKLKGNAQPKASVARGKPNSKAADKVSQKKNKDV
jgi:NADH-quinone oxidoreductase E subunit